jgi:hypothetical protein
MATIRSTDAIGEYAKNAVQNKHTPDFIIIDEDPQNRKAIQNQLQGLHVDFYGAKERSEWFQNHCLGEVSNVIPHKYHNKVSFGMLVALTRKYDMLVFVDDDTYPFMNVDFLGEHWKNLNTQYDSCYSKNSDWVNSHPFLFARGFPYNQRLPKDCFSKKCDAPPILSLGLWAGIPDLNAIDYICYNIQYQHSLTVSNFSVGKNQFAPIGGMNVAFKPEIIPAYYQMFFADRFEDIFSGIFLLKITSHLGFCVNIGNPIITHKKAPRDYFDDSIIEMSTLKFNEQLWQIVKSVELSNTTWLTCYRELASKLLQKVAECSNPQYLKTMAEKMLLWCDIVEHIQDIVGKSK